MSISALPASGDALAECLAQVTRLLGQPATAESLLAGLPLGAQGLTPELFLRAAERAGYSARVVNAGLERVSKLDLPAVLLLKDRGA